MDILKKYASNDKRIKIIHNKKNMGLSYSRNKGLELATGKYILFVDSDDMLIEGSLSAMYDKAVETQADGVMFDLASKNETTINHNNISEFNSHKYDYTGVYTGQELFTVQMNNNDLQLMAFLCLWKRDFLLLNNIFFKEGILHEDNPFSIRALMYAGKMAFLRRECYLYRRRDNSITTVSTLEEKKVIGLVRGNVDIIEALAQYDADLEQDFSISVLKFIFYVRRLVRAKLINSALCGENINYPQDIDFMELLEWKTILRAGYIYLKGTISFENIQKLMKCKMIIVYGNGKIGTEVINLLKEYDLNNYQVAITENESGEYKNGSMAGVSIISDLVDEQEKKIVIIAVGQKLQEELKKNAFGLGFENVIVAREL